MTRLPDPLSSPPQATFSSSVGVLFTALGSAVGTGNIWRFSRIMARHADEGGVVMRNAFGLQPWPFNINNMDMKFVCACVCVCVCVCACV